MQRLYDLLLKSKYALVDYYGPKAFSFEETNGNWSKRFTVSKYGTEYIVKGHEGTTNFIRTFEAKFKTYQEVVNYLGL